MVYKLLLIIVNLMKLNKAYSLRCDLDFDKTNVLSVLPINANYYYDLGNAWIKYSICGSGKTICFYHAY